MELREHLKRMKRILNEVIYSEEKQNLKKIVKTKLSGAEFVIQYEKTPKGIIGKVYSEYPMNPGYEHDFLFDIEGRSESEIQSIFNDMVKQAEEEYANYTDTPDKFMLKTFYFQVPGYDEPLAIEARSFEKAIEELETIYGKGFLWRVKLLKAKDANPLPF